MGQPEAAPRVEQPTAVELPELAQKAVVTAEGEPPTLQLFVAGEWRPAASGETFEVRSPIDDNQIAVAQAADQEDVEAAIDAALNARAGFREMAAAERIEICERGGGDVRALRRLRRNDRGRPRQDAEPGEVGGDGDAGAARARSRGGAQDLRRVHPRVTGYPTRRASRGSSCANPSGPSPRSGPSTIPSS